MAVSSESKVNSHEQEIVMNVRRKWQSVKWIAAVLCGMAMSEASHAAVIYEYISDVQSYSVPVGGSINVQIYLKETTTNGSPSIITSDGNMLGAGVSVARLAAGLPSSPAAFPTDGTSVTRNTVDFKGPNGTAGANGQGNPTATDISFNEAVDTQQPAAPLGNTGGGAAPSIANALYLGSVKILAGAQPGATTFALRVYDPVFFGRTLTNNNFYDLDVTNNGGSTPVYTGASQKTNTFTVNTTDVPEPAALGLVLGAGMFGLTRRRRV